MTKSSRRGGSWISSSICAKFTRYLVKYGNFGVIVLGAAFDLDGFFSIVAVFVADMPHLRFGM